MKSIEGEEERTRALESPDAYGSVQRKVQNDLEEN